MLVFSCFTCDHELTAPEESVGSMMRCPACQVAMIVPEPKPAVAEVDDLPIAEDASYGHDRDLSRNREEDDRARRNRDNQDSRPPRRRNDDRDLPPRRRYDEDDNNFRRRRSAYANCPRCRSDDATRLYWSWWGGWIGPMVLNSVRCNDCDTVYSGTTGRRHGAGHVVLYLLLSIAAFAVLVFFAILVRLL